MSRLSSGSLSLMAAAPSDMARLFAARKAAPGRPGAHRRLRAGRPGVLRADRRPVTGHRTRRVDGPAPPRPRPGSGRGDAPGPILAAPVGARRHQPKPDERIADVAEFLERLAAAREDVLGKATGTDPLEAGREPSWPDGSRTAASSVPGRRQWASWSPTIRWAAPNGC
ncbi:serine/threonine kinase domain protein [Mycobacterium xenopi 3993]|nr:serine/threonine kinase domain protein [Mycobacterium xenopi 3993]